MTLELIVFIASVLFGILIYWRESHGNKVYRFFNKIFYSKELQMKADNPKGFVYEQSFMMRLVFVTFLFLLAIVFVRFLIPIDLATISIFASCIVGTIIGTYVGGLLLNSERIIEEKGDSFGEAFQNTMKRGKEFVDDLKSSDTQAVDEAKEEIKEPDDVNQKSARERLKDKGLL